MNFQEDHKKSYHEEDGHKKKHHDEGKSFCTTITINITDENLNTLQEATMQNTKRVKKERKGTNGKSMEASKKAIQQKENMRFIN